MRVHRTSTLALATVATGALLAGCTAAEDAANGEDVNNADVEFAQQMIPHHQQAIVMSAMVPDSTDTEELIELSEDITAEQESEIDMMSTQLEQWDEPVPETDMGMDHGDMDHGDMDHGDMDMGMDHGDMPGMMSPEQMDSLSESEGDQFDRMFYEMMIEHHEGAIGMAETQLDQGTHGETTELAEEIIESQREEIAEMEQRLETME